MILCSIVPSFIGVIDLTLKSLAMWCYLWDRVTSYDAIQCISTSSFDLKSSNVSTRLPSPIMDLYDIGGAVEYNNLTPST